MGLFDRLRGGDGPRVAFFGIDGVPYSLVADNPNDDGGLSGPTTSLLESQRLTPENTLRNPDNIVVLDDGRVVIGEDSSRQQNMVWIFAPGSENAGASDSA